MPDPQEMLLPDGRKLTLVHFTYRAGSGANDRWVIACTPNADALHGVVGHHLPWHRSDDPRAVTCPGCKWTDAYKGALVLLGIMP